MTDESFTGTCPTCGQRYHGDRVVDEALIIAGRAFAPGLIEAALRQMTVFNTTEEAAAVVRKALKPT